MKLRIDEVGIGDLVRELSADALRYFAEMELSDDWPSYQKPLQGKFVRLGEVILLGAAIDYGPKLYGERRSLKHIDLLAHGQREMDEDVLDRINASAPKEGQYLKDRWPLTDAGWSSIKTDEAGHPVSLTLDDESYDYGRASESVRQRTGEIARHILGTEIAVIVK